MNPPQLPIISKESQLAWITRYQAAMAEIDRQLAELPKIIEQCQAEIH